MITYFFNSRGFDLKVSVAVDNLSICSFDSFVDLAVKIVDKHVSVLHFGIAVVPHDAALPHFNERPVDVVSVRLHNLFDLVDPGEIFQLRKFMPPFFVAGAVQVARLRH